MKTSNRGKQSSDDKWFATKWHPTFTNAVNDLSFLLSRGYSNKSALQVVGNHYRLNKRQRIAISRVSCSSQNIIIRNQTKCNTNELKNRIIEIDGFNQLILLESILSGAYIFKCRDGLYRDISSVHGSYKRVVKTEEAILLIGNFLQKLNVKAIIWYFDQPVSNSGRLKTKLMQISMDNEFNWQVNLVYDPDKILAQSENIVISSDGWIINHVRKWFNLGAYLLENHYITANIIAV